MSTTANPNPTPEQAARIAWHAMFVAREAAVTAEQAVAPTP